MELPQLPVPHSEFIPYISSTDKHIRHAVEPFRTFENSLREVYAQDRDNKILDDPDINLVPIFAGQQDKVTVHCRDLSSELQSEKDKYLLRLPTGQRRANGTPAITESLRSFRNNFNIFSESSLVDLDWSNVVVAGSSAVTALLPVDAPHNESKRALRQYYHEQLAPASDVDLFLYGLTEEQALEKIKQIEASVRDSILYETTVVRTKYAITIASQYPCRHVQIVLRIYKNISEILTGFDVDSSCVAYDGSQVYATPRAIAAFMTQTNTVDLSRRSPSYENRLSKYSHRGFEVYCPTLDRTRIDPTIFERSFGRVLGLARLLVLERLPMPGDRDNYLAQRRKERGRPCLPMSSRHRSMLYGNIKEEQPDDVPEWVEEDELSFYHTFSCPYGPKFHAKKIEKLLFTKDLLLNAEWNKPKGREVNLHRHPAFFGRVSDVVQDCCGFCPEPTNEEEALVAEKQAEIYIEGKISFITDHPGRQQIGSFNPLTEDDWTEMAYVGNTARLCQAIVDGELEHVQDWCSQDDADVNRRDHTGRTPLQLATMCSTPEVVKCLIDHGARIVARLVDGQTALHLAARRGNAAMIKIILEKSEENEAEEERKLERRRDETRTRVTATKDALATNGSASEGSEQSFVTDDNDSDSDVDEDMTQGSFVRVKGGRDESIDAEADKDEPDVYDVNVLAWDYPTSPLHLAIMGGHVDAVKTLVDTFGADLLLPIKIKDDYSNEPKASILSLMLAAKFSPDGPQMTHELLKLGASSSQADMDENTALHFIVNDSDMTVLEMLLKHDEPAAKAAIRHLCVTGYQYRPEVRTCLLLAIHNRDENMALRLIDLGAPTTVTEEAFAQSYQRKFHDASQSPDYMKHMCHSHVNQPLVAAIQSDMPRLAARLANDFNANALEKTAMAGLPQPGGGYQRSLTKGEAKSVLDLIRDRIQALEESLTAEKAKRPPKPEVLQSDDHYMQGLEVDTYRYWLARKDLQCAKLILKAMESEYRKKLDTVQESVEESGSAEKRLAVESALTAFKELEARLIGLGAKTFTELHPDIVLNDIPNYNYIYGSGLHLDESYKTEFKFLVPDIDDAKHQGYVELFEAAWSGDMTKLKALVLAPWKPSNVSPHATASATMQPLKVAVQDARGFSPYSLAVLRGHAALAKTIVEIATIQYNPKQDETKYRYSLRPLHSHDDNDSEDDSDRDEAGPADRDNIKVPVYTQIVDERYTIDDVATLATAVDSKTSPQVMVDWACETWRFYGSIERAIEAGVSAPSRKQKIWTGYGFPAEKEYSQSHLCYMLRYIGNKSTLLAYAVGENDLGLLRFILSIGSDLIERQEDEKSDVAKIYRVGSSVFEQAVRLGRTEILGELLRSTGAELPLNKMVEKSGVEVKERPKFYQGLTVYGRKRDDWANESRGVVSRQVIESDTPPLLRAAFASNVESTDFFLSEAPHRRYEEFIRAHKDDKAITALDKEAGGATKAIASWLKARSNLTVHASVLAAPDKHRPIEQLKFILNAVPQYMDGKNCDQITALHLAFRFHRYAAAQYLITQGADQAARDRSAENILHHFMRSPSLSDKNTIIALQAFIRLIDPPLLTILLLQRSSSRAGSHTPLSLLMSLRQNMDANDVELIKVILEYSKGKDLQIMNGSGDYPLHTAARIGCTRLVRLFIDTNPSLLYRENAVGMTPLEIADTAVLRQRSTNITVLPRGDAPARQLPDHQPREFLFEPKSPDESGNDNVLTACLQAVKKYPGKRKLVSLLDANEVAKRLANEETGFEQYETGKGDNEKDEVNEWMSKAAEFKKWDLIKLAREKEGKSGWESDESE
ncbi:ankyrin [Myriangium duriaei CBS 260.36]|uniref:Ankyrin n=1 Tax=Myriangium duriaei CBS 260.36 TaxID=1168546 RepID=A0A9P4IVF2_9PEZI|nr:ankyrin [Myriangium duriaei CBS 260.36]